VFLLAFELWSFVLFLLCFRFFFLFLADRKARAVFCMCFRFFAKLDLLRFAGDLASRPAPLCSSSAYEAASSNSGGGLASTRGTWSSRARGDLRVGEPRSFFPAGFWGVSG